jgi:hypothetical protein
MGSMATFRSSFGINGDEYFDQFPIDRPIIAGILGTCPKLLHCYLALSSPEGLQTLNSTNQLILRKVEIVEADDRPDVAKIVGFDNTVLGALV